MADLEKVIQRIEYILSDNRSEDGFFLPVLETVETLEDALELLKAQEPVKPMVVGSGHTFEEAETWWYECGNCGTPIDPSDQYCRKCGRAVKWDA